MSLALCTGAALLFPPKAEPVVVASTAPCSLTPLMPEDPSKFSLPPTAAPTQPLL